MTKRSLDHSWYFIDSEMLHFASTLANSKLQKNKEDLAKAIFEITSSRFQSPKHSVRIFRMFMPEPAYNIWRKGGKVGSLKQSIVVKSMLLATGQFGEKDIFILRSAPSYYTVASGGHFYLKIKFRGKSIYQDSWGREWKVSYGERYVSGRADIFSPPKVWGDWDIKHQTQYCTLYVKS